MVSLKEKREEELKKSARNISIVEGSMYSVSDGFGFRNITPYMLEIGKNLTNLNLYVGLLSSLPSLLGNFSQLFSARLMEKYSRKNIVVTGVLLQSLLWLVLLVPGFLYFMLGRDQNLSAIYLIVIYSILIFAGAIAGPAWSSWMKSIVPLETRGKYFGNRSRIIGFFALIFALLGGFILDYFKQTKVFIAFVILFAFSAIFRIIGAYLFKKQYEPKFKLNKKYYFTFIQFVKKMPFNNFGRFTIFLSLISFSVAIASPFFAVYVLKDLGFSYTTFVITTLFSALFSLLSMGFWGRLADKYGALKLMKFNGVFTTIIPLLYFLTTFIDNRAYLIIYICLIESFSGFVWAGFNLASGNFIYNAVTTERMGLCTSYYGFLNAVGSFLGAGLGGLIAIFDFGIISGVLFIFLLSSLARYLVFVIMIKKIKEVQVIKGKNMDFKKELKEEFRDIFGRLSEYSHNLRFFTDKEAE